MWFELQLKGLEYDISFDPIRSLFVVPDFAWKTKNKKMLKSSAFCSDHLKNGEEFCIRVCIQSSYPFFKWSEQKAELLSIR